MMAAEDSYWKGPGRTSMQMKLNLPYDNVWPGGDVRWGPILVISFGGVGNLGMMVIQLYQLSVEVCSPVTTSH